MKLSLRFALDNLFVPARHSWLSERWHRRADLHRRPADLAGPGRRDRPRPGRAGGSRRTRGQHRECISAFRISALVSSLSGLPRERLPGQPSRDIL